MSVKTVITETSGFFRKPSSVIHIPTRPVLREVPEGSGTERPELSGQWPTKQLTGKLTGVYS